MENHYRVLADIFDFLSGRNLHLYCASHRIIIRIDNISKLSNARKIIKMYVPKWKDKIDCIWNCGQKINVSWANKDFKYIEIWLTTAPENFPKQLLKKGCKLEKQIEEVPAYTQKKYAVVCQTRG